MTNIKEMERTEFPLDKQKLQELKKRKGYSNETLSLVLTMGESNSIIRYWLSETEVHPQKIYGEKICKILDCKYSDLFHAVQKTPEPINDTARLLTLISNKLDEIDTIKSLLIAINNSLVDLGSKWS